MMEAADIRRLLGLEPHPLEGGYYAETYRSDMRLGSGAAGGHVSSAAAPAGDPRPIATAIYFMITPDAFSAMHRLGSDEIFHFYLGDPVEMLQLDPSGGGRVLTLGTDLAAGMRPQVVVPGGVWQGSRLKPGGSFALLGTTVSPGFDFRDYTTGEREALTRRSPGFEGLIRSLTR